ncbi:MAG: pitrilysin family protein [Desulfuromonadales bacterium]|nr:pitrilysin family protein [Desulfuromonadales bacterium]
MEYFCTTLDNGLRVVSVPMPHHHSCEMLVSLAVGSRHESQRQSGISHFLEHLLFKGTVDYRDGLALERAFEAVGGSANAATDSESTTFHSRIHPDHLEKGAALFASLLLRPLLCDLDLERRVILEEALGDLNENGRQVNPDNIVAALLFGAHPLGLPTVGHRTAIQRLNPDQIRRHYQRHYVPANTVMAVAGPVEHARVLAAAEQFFAGWQGAPPPAGKPWQEPPLTAPKLRWVRDAGSQVSLQLAFLLPGRESAHAINLRVLRRLLSWGGMSRLMLRLREQLGLTYAVEAMLAQYADAGLLAIDLAVSPHNLVPAVRAILDLLRELHQDEVGSDELAHLLASYRYDLDYSRDQVDEMALRYAWCELSGCRRTIAADLANLDRVDAAGLQRTAQTLLTPERLCLVAVGPYRPADRRATEQLIAAWRP